MSCSLYGICRMPSLAGGTVFARGCGITPAAHGGVEWDLSVWPAAGWLILPQ